MAGSQKALSRRAAISPPTLQEKARELRARSTALVSRALELRDESHERAEFVGQAIAGTLRVEEELRRSVRDYAAILRQLGEPPEKAVVNVKEIAWEAAQSLDHPLRVRPLDRQGLVNNLVRWTVAAYFGHDPVTVTVADQSRLTVRAAAARDAAVLVGGDAVVLRLEASRLLVERRVLRESLARHRVRSVPDRPES